MQQFTHFLITPIAPALSSLSPASLPELSLSFVPWGVSFPLRPILWVFLVWQRPGKEWSCRRRVAWRVEVLSPRGHLGPEVGDGCSIFPTDKSALKRPAKPIVRQAWGGGRVWGSHWARMLGDGDWGSSWFYLELRICLYWLMCCEECRTEGGRESRRDAAGFSPISHTHTPASSHT